MVFSSRMHYMWTDPGSVADFDPGPASSAMEAYALYSTCGVGSFQNISTVNGKEQCPPCNRFGDCTFEQIASNSYVCSKCDRCSMREYVESWSQCDGIKQDPFTPTCRPVSFPLSLDCVSNPKPKKKKHI